MPFLLFSAGLLAIIKGADWLTDGAIWAAKRLAIPEVIIGATLLSVATTLPELAVSALAASSGHPDLAIGNVIGSCIANIGLILGLSVAISGVLSVKARPFTGKIVLAVLASLLALALTLDGNLSRQDGVILLFTFLAYILYIVRNLYTSRGNANSNASRTTYWRFLLGVILLIGGSRLTVSSGVALARLLGVPESVIGVSLISVGTSLPELTASVISAIKGHFALSVGNVVGANMLNLTLVLGTAALIAPAHLHQAALLLDVPTMVYFGLILLILSWISSTRERWKGASLLISYASYLWAVFSR